MLAELELIEDKSGKRISMKIGIEKNVTTYYGRHSAATIMKKSGPNIEQIREALGHQSMTTLKSILPLLMTNQKENFLKA